MVPQNLASWSSTDQTGCRWPRGAGSPNGVKPKQLFCFGNKEILNRNQNEESCPELVQFFISKFLWAPETPFGTWNATLITATIPWGYILDPERKILWDWQIALRKRSLSHLLFKSNQDKLSCTATSTEHSIRFKISVFIKPFSNSQSCNNPDGSDIAISSVLL